MKMLLTLTALLLSVASLSFAGEKKLVSGPQAGTDMPGAFYPKNVTGPFAGKAHCLYCEFGACPVVMVFARNTASPGLDKLLKEVDAVTARHQNLNMGFCVIVLSAKDDLEKDLVKLAREYKLKNTILAMDHPAGPLDYKLAREADLTVLIYDELSIHANHAFRAGQLDDKGVSTILADVNKMLKK
jgi:hypothetical protein